MNQEKLHIFFILLAIGMVVLSAIAGRAGACEPPMFPVNAQMSAIFQKETAHTPLSMGEQAAVSAYNRDYEVYSTLYNELYPCDLPNGADKADADKAALQAQMDALLLKWQEEGGEEISVAAHASSDDADDNAQNTDQGPADTEPNVQDNDRVIESDGYYEIDLNEGSYNFE